MSVQISASGSIHIRGLLTDCDGTAITAAYVSAVKINIFEYDEPNTPVADYTNLTVPTTTIISPALEDEDGNLYNFDCNPYLVGKPMFPKRRTAYVVEVVFYDLEGRPSAHQVEVDAI